MGTFMASVSFKKPENGSWLQTKEKVHQWLLQVDGLNHNLDSEYDAFSIVSPYGESGPLLSQMAPALSKLIEGVVIFANCCDSDFDLLEVYQNGSLVEKSYIGEVFEEYMEFGEYSKPNPEFWKTLLLDESSVEEMYAALSEEAIFAEDNLRKLSELTGYPIFDDGLVFR